MIRYIGGDEDASDSKSMQVAQSIAASIENGDHILAISTILYVEILESKMPKKAIERFEKFLLNKDIVKNVPVSINIAKKAQALRNRNQGLKTPDAIHIATAIFVEANVFHTFDKQLLKLDGKEEVKGLRITACEIPGESGRML